MGGRMRLDPRGPLVSLQVLTGGGPGAGGCASGARRCSAPRAALRRGGRNTYKGDLSCLCGFFPQITLSSLLPCHNQVRTVTSSNPHRHKRPWLITLCREGSAMPLVLEILFQYLLRYSKCITRTVLNFLIQATVVGKDFVISTLQGHE